MAKRKGMDRRQFVTTTGAAAAAAVLGPTISVKQQQKTLKIIQWSHFVPAYDAWFDKYAKDWGTAKGVDVTVDHISLADLTTRANAEVAAQQGHDLFQFLSPPGAFEPQVLDMADVVKEAERQHGPLVDLCKRSTYNPVTRTEEHTSELQSQSNLVCRLLLEKKKKQKTPTKYCEEDNANP